MADVLISGLPVAGTIDPAVSSVPIVVGTTTSKTTCNAIVQAALPEPGPIGGTTPAAGSFRVTFADVSGTTTEQPVFNFAVIKAVTA